MVQGRRDVCIGPRKLGVVTLSVTVEAALSPILSSRPLTAGVRLPDAQSKSLNLSELLPALTTSTLLVMLSTRCPCGVPGGHSPLKSEK